MNVIRTDGPWNAEGRAVCAAIGVFDGVHLGHQSILRRTMDDAGAANGIAAVITFDRHPNEVVAPERTPPLIYPLSKKLRALKEFGADAVRIIHFDKAFSQLAAEDFVRRLAAEAGNLKSICVGAGFTFGHRRQGNVELLRRLGAKLSFAVDGVGDVRLEGETVSSTRVRQTVREGRFDLAGRLLGRDYTLAGTVRRGAQLGRKLGFPTANVDVAGIVTPPTGVYAAEASVGGIRRCAAVNIGFRPTVETNAVTLHVEAHLVDFHEEIYGQEMELLFLRKLREEQKFASLDALKAQVEQDIAAARTAEKV